MPADWDLLTRVFLHDPPDKALDIRGHEARAARHLAAALGREIDPATIKADATLADTLSAIAERLPMPTAGADGQRAVSVEHGRLVVYHPLGGGARQIAVPGLGGDMVEAAIEEIAAGLDDARLRFLALWRLLPERLAKRDPAYAMLPADTRVPDHTIWHHADAACALLAANSGAGAAFISFAIAPVQSFIEAARSLRDLWSGSLILSWLAFEALLPVAEDVGPAALIFPYLRGNPLLDLWLRAQGPTLADKIDEPASAACARPSLPNRFLALVPAADATSLAARCERAARAAWRDLAEAVRQRLGGGSRDFPGWDSLWQQQIDEFWEIRSSTLRYSREISSDDQLAHFYGADYFAEAWPEAARIRGLADLISYTERPAYDQKHAGRWQATVDLAARALEARRSIRHVPKNIVPGDSEIPEKCSLLGTIERMGPATRNRNSAFWERLAAQNIDGIQLRAREYFSAVALTKRFALSAYLAKRLGVDRHHHFPDTATVAARLWLRQAEIEPDAERQWNGQWLHWTKHNQDKDEDPVSLELWERIKKARDDYGRPPAYLAVLVMDGDHMGRWLRGEMNPTVGAAIHPKMRGYFEKIGGASTLGEARRPVGPALHAAISEALTNFATSIAPGIVAEHRGVLIYAGGDDLLALLPTEKAIACAAALNYAFTASGGYWQDGNGNRELLVMGDKATVSAGIAVVHYKEDLRAALGLARQAERTAKQTGRNCLHLFIARRSGERTGETLGWDECSTMNKAVEKFVAGASDRWAYRLRGLVQSLPPVAEAFDLEMTRQLGRSDDKTKAALEGLVDKSAFRRDGRGAESVVRLWQAASFLARGRDEGAEG